MTLFTDATKMQRKTLSHYDNLVSQRYHFLLGAFCYTLSGIKAQFMIRKKEPMVIARLENASPTSYSTSLGLWDSTFVAP